MHEVTSGCGLASPAGVCRPSVGLWEASIGPRGALGAGAGCLVRDNRTGSAVTTGHHAPAAGTVSASVTALTEGMLTMMFRTKLKSVVGAVLSVGIARRWNGRARASDGGSPGAETDGQRGRNGGISCLEKGRPATKAESNRAGDSLSVPPISRRTGEDEGLTGLVAIDPKTGTGGRFSRGSHWALAASPPTAATSCIRVSVQMRTPEDQVGIWIYDMNG